MSERVPHWVTGSGIIGCFPLGAVGWGADAFPFAIYYLVSGQPITSHD